MTTALPPNDPARKALEEEKQILSALDEMTRTPQQPEPAPAAPPAAEQAPTPTETAQQRIERFDQEFVARFEPVERTFEEAQATGDEAKVRTLAAEYARIIEDERTELIREIQDAKDYSEAAVNTYGAEAPETQEAADAVRRWTTALEQFSSWCDVRKEMFDAETVIESMREWREQKAREAVAPAVEPGEPGKPSAVSTPETVVENEGTWKQRMGEITREQKAINTAMLKRIAELQAEKERLDAELRRKRDTEEKIAQLKQQI